MLPLDIPLEKPTHCSHKDCTSAAKYMLGVRAWAKGHVRTSIPIELFSGLGICEYHKPDYLTWKVAEFLPPETQEMINQIMASQRRIEPDYERAEFFFYPLEQAS